ncbi:hypothetical protein H4R27_000848 [Coemansia aciculifera]|nr:hypothetical protein H4R27_000848 [Coemansia aciculifera]
MEDHINVAIRVRPLNQRERSSTASTLGQTPWQVQRDTITQKLHADGRICSGTSFTFDKVFDQKDTTQTVYNDIVKEIITSSMSGFNGTIFTYGQTSSGKTHTMYGSGTELGIIKLAVRNMFDIVANDTTREYLIRVSFLEIYNEIIRDLLEPTMTNLKIHENPKREIYVGELSHQVVFNADEVEEVLLKGDSNRQVAGTNMNERSSRSHTIFSIVVESREKADPTAASAATSACGPNGRDSDVTSNGRQRLSTGSAFESGKFTGAVKVSSLNLVDLAGSERVGQTGVEGQRLKEGAHINKSLLSLGTVIARLAEDGGDRGHIPYRDSKLTRILQPSLGGNAKTLIICTITPSPDYIEEALSTLKFASRAKTIQNKPEVNEERRGNALLHGVERCSELEMEVAQLRNVEVEKEALLRNLWKMQKEHDQLEKKYENMKKSLFTTTNGNVTVASSIETRRQTWYPGIQRTQSDISPALNRSSLGPPTAITGGLATPMDVDDEIIGEAVTIRSRSSARLSGSSDQQTEDRTSDFELQIKTLQDKYDEASKSNQEMGRALERITRDYNLILSELSKLSAADTIPPSPVRTGSSSAPRELTEIRQKLRTLIVAMDESRKQALKIRSQRPEAEFLEMELQAIRETLVQKEEELAVALREAEQLRTGQAETVASLARAEDLRMDYKKQLADALKEHNGVRAKLEQERCGLTSLLRSQKEKMVEMESELQSANAVLQAKLDEQLSLSEQHLQLSKSLEDEQQQLCAALEGANAMSVNKQVEVDILSRDLGEMRQRVSELELKLDEVTTAHGAVKDACLEAKAKVQELEAEKANAVDSSAKLTELATQLKSKITAMDIVVSEQREQIDSLQVAASEAAADRVSLQIKVDNYTQMVSGLKAGASASVEAAQRELDARAAELSGLRQELEAARLASADSASTRQKLGDVEEVLRQCNVELADARAAFDNLSAARALDKEELREHHANLERMAEQLSAMNTQLENTVHEHTLVLTERDSQLATLHDLQSKAVERTDQLEAQLASTNAHLSSMQAELAEQKLSLDAELLLKAELCRQIEANAATMPELEAHMAELRKEMDTKTLLLSESERQRELLLTQLGEERTAAQAQALQLRATIDDRRKDLDEAADKHYGAIRELEARLLAELNHIDELQQTIVAGKHTEAELREQLGLSTATKEVLANELQELRTHVNKLLADFSVAEDEVKQMQAKAEDAERVAGETRRVLQAQVDELRAQNDRAIEEVAQLQRVRDELISDVQRYKALAESSETAIVETAKLLRNTESASNAMIAGLKTQLSAVTAERDGLLRETVDKHAQLGDVTSEHASLKDELDALREEREQLSAKHASLSSLAISLSANLESTTTKYNEVLVQCSEQQGLAESYAVQLKDLESVSVDRAAELAKAKEEYAAYENKVLELSQSLNKQTTECARLSTQIGDEIEQQHIISDRLAATEAELNTVNTDRLQHRHRIDELEAELSDQHDALSKLQQSISEIHSGYASAKQAALERIESLEADITSLRQQLYVQHAKYDTLEKELEDSRAATNEALSANGAVSDESEKLRADYEALTDRSKSMQADMEQAIADIKSELSSKSAEISALEAALESANSALEAAKTEERDAAHGTIEKLESKLAVSERRTAELEESIASMRAEIEQRTGLEETAMRDRASLAEAIDAIERLVAERDQALQDISELKLMMTKLADIKDAQFAEVVEKLDQQGELLQATTDESLQKDELVKQLEGEAAEHLLRAKNAEADMDKALAQSSLDTKKLTTERDSLETELAEASVTRAQLEAQVVEITANGDRLQAEIKRQEQAAAELQQSLDHATSSLADADAGAAVAKQECLDLVASVSAELLAIAKSLSTLPGCARVADIDVEATSTSYQVLLGAIQEMTAVAVAGAAASAQTETSTGESAQYEQDIARLQALNEKLEKKNAKLRDMYKSDMTALHAEEEKQRQRAESLAKELADSVRQIEVADGELARVRGDLEAQSQRRMELEATMEQQAQACSPAPDGKTKAAMARLASQRTPMAQENKRAYLVSSSVATLSPISSSTLNSRLGMLEDQQQNRYPARKRTAPAFDVLGTDTSAAACANGVESAAKVDPLRARSNYGDRRRLRRNQQAPRSDALEEQATEQCVQQ